MATGEEVVRTALDRLKSTLTTDDVRMFSNTSIKDLWCEVRRIEKEQGARRDLLFMRRIERYLRSLESYSSVIEVFCQGYAPMAFIWGPIKMMLLLVRNYANILDDILKAFSDIANVLPRVDRLKATFPDDTNFNHVVGLIISDIFEFHRRAYKIFRRKAWYFWFAFDWGLFERRFKWILQKLAGHCDLLDKEAASAHFSAMKQFRDKRQLEEDTFEEQRQNQMAQDVFRWLSAAEDEQEEQLHRISDKRQPETCDWVLEDPQVRSWIEDDCGDMVLWMTGIPGAGKSFLCSLLVQNLQSQQHLSTLYYFCSHQSSSENACTVMLRTLAVQLLQQNLGMASLVHQAYLQKGSNRSRQVMKALLIKLLPTSKTTRIVIDGMDENHRGTQEEILKTVTEIQKGTDHSCKFLVSSREEPQIQKLLATQNHLRIGKRTAEGLTLYIKDRIEVLQTCFPAMDASLVSLAEQQLQSQAKGMFLWVRLVTDMLTHQTSELDFERAINQLPEGLDEAYGRIQSRIDSLLPLQLRQRAFTILYWVCVARRPVSIHEVVDGIALHSGQTILNKRTRSNNPSRDIIEVCAPLLEKRKNDILSVVHFSAKEYLIHQQSGFFVDVTKAHFSIALSCVINLTSCLDLVPRNADSIREEELESRVVQGYYGLQSYGQEFWAEHALAYLGKVGSQESEAKRLVDALETFSQVCKHRSYAASTSIAVPQGGTSLLSTFDTAEASSGLDSLRNLPTLHRFVSSWLHFKSEFSKARTSFSTLDTQEQWKLRKDETFLSLIDYRLCNFTEQLLMMQSNQLPSHIDERDFKEFVSRFKFPCRYHGCSHQFDTVQERDSHEASHVVYFPCLQCDFSGRGFTSRKVLESHTQRYHMSPEDFEIPEDLQTMRKIAREGPNVIFGEYGMPPSRSGQWTERGRKALQQGFQHVLTNLCSKVAATTGDDGDPDSKTYGKAIVLGKSRHTNEPTTMKNLETIRHKIDEQEYLSLEDFKSDLSALIRDPTMSSVFTGNERLESICDDELEKAMSVFPALANFDHTASAKDTVVAFSGTSTVQLQECATDVNGRKTEMVCRSPVSSVMRGPYWSQPEEKQFPNLLQRFGRDFARIASCLKTKTPEEVSQHFSHLLSMGRTELSYSADLAEARLEQETCRPSGITHLGDAGLETRALDDSANENPCHFLQTSKDSDARLYLSHSGNPNAPPPLTQSLTKQAESNMVSSEKEDGPVRKKRPPRPRALCPHCSLYKDGLHDEYALVKHIERHHTATRKVWICEDISFDKRFFTKCKPCLASKRYPSKNLADKHLRQAHFNSETSAETLRRWMRKLEEPNPTMKTPSAESTSTTKPMVWQQATGRDDFSLPPIKDHQDSSGTLPNTILGVKSREPSKSPSSSVDSERLNNNLDGAAEIDARDKSLSVTDPRSSSRDLLLDSLSFDNFLPRGANVPPLLDSDDLPHRINRTLIKPDQVPRLPNLDSFRRTACLDQVEALYYKLDNVQEHHSIYKEALESLTVLSRSLMNDLRDWRRDLTFAPHIPVSI